MGGTKLNCSRCGVEGHCHEQCNAEAKAVIWGIDWRERRQNRKRWREAERRRKSAGVKTRGGVKIKPTAGTTGVGTLAVSKRLRQERKPVKAAQAAARSSMHSLEFKEVADERGVGAKMRSSPTLLISIATKRARQL